MRLKSLISTLRFDEQKQYFIHRIDFSGNTTTRDKVIRRQLVLDEGSLFNKRLWELSILRLNQLDFFDRIEADKAAEIKRNNKDGTVDITSAQGKGQAVHRTAGRRQRPGWQLHRPHLPDQQLPRPCEL